MDKTFKKERIDSICRQIGDLEERIANFDEAVRVCMQPNVERLVIMKDALIRDVEEVKQAGGAKIAKTEQLCLKLEKDVNSLEMEIEALSQGSPTPLDIAADAVFRGIDKVVDKFSDKKHEIKEAYEEGLDSVTYDTDDK